MVIVLKRTWVNGTSCIVGIYETRAKAEADRDSIAPVVGAVYSIEGYVVQR